MANELSRMGRWVSSMWAGLAVTAREGVSRPITVLYPEEKPPYPLGSRSIPTLKVNEESGLLNCTSCGLCERACPPQVIHIEQAVDPASGRKKPWPAQYTLEYDHCMVCNICVEVCPFDALEMADVTELASYQVGSLTFDKDRLADLWKTSHAIRIHDGMAMPEVDPTEGAGLRLPGADADKGSAS
jgi:NADH-quinone oxidoreductase subunit I